jgi:hypothetical protein
MENLANMES